MNTRYSRGGLSGGSGALNRGSGGSHARASSPEPGGGTPGGDLAPPGGEHARGPPTPLEEVIHNLEKESMELRSLVQQRDQRIAELSRTDTPAARLKKDVRLLAAELHSARKQLRESVGANSELRKQMEQLRNTPSRSNSHNGSSALPAERAVEVAELKASTERNGMLEDENGQLRQAVNELQAALSLSREQQEQAAAQAAAQAAMSRSTNKLSAAGAAGGAPAAGATSQAAAQYAVSVQVAPPQEAEEGGGENVEMVVYSSHHHEHALTIGRLNLMGIGSVEGASQAAKVLLSQVKSSVYNRQSQQQLSMAYGMQTQMGQMGQQMTMVAGYH